MKNVQTGFGIGVIEVKVIDMPGTQDIVMMPVHGHIICGIVFLIIMTADGVIFLQMVEVMIL